MKVVAALQALLPSSWTDVQAILAVFGAIALALSPWVIKWGRSHFGDSTVQQKNVKAIEGLTTAGEALAHRLEEIATKLDRHHERMDDRMRSMETIQADRYRQLTEDLAELRKLTSRVAALETQDLLNRRDIAEHEREIRRIEGIDRRLYRVATVLAAAFPEAARNVNLLEEINRE